MSLGTCRFQRAVSARRHITSHRAVSARRHIASHFASCRDCALEATRTQGAFPDLCAGSNLIVITKSSIVSGQEASLACFLADKVCKLRTERVKIGNRRSLATAK